MQLIWYYMAVEYLTITSLGQMLSSIKNHVEHSGQYPFQRKSTTPSITSSVAASPDKYLIFPWWLTFP